MSNLDDIIFLDRKPVKKERKENMAQKKSTTNAVKSIGLDVGTGWICGSYHKTKTKIEYVPLRSCFLDSTRSLIGEDNLIPKLHSTNLHRYISYTV